MVDRLDTLLYVWRGLFVGVLFIASLFLLSFLFSSISVQGGRANSRSDTSLSNSPNLITSGMVRTTDSLGKTTGSVAHSLSTGLRNASSAIVQGGKRVAHGVGVGATAIVRGTVGGLSFVGRTIGTGIGFVFRIPGRVLGAVSSVSIANAVIRPSDHVEVPIIDPDSPELHAALAALPPAKPADTAVDQHTSGPAWPMHGDVTTEFGVGHWPYQRTHTGIDISDHRPSGITPIRPFRSGRVIQTAYSRGGLGNHVIVDHGNGVTSVYAHLNSITVQEGQEVSLATTLGLEGTTGVSTGTHLHFEIRINGQAANPRHFIGGQP